MAQYAWYVSAHTDRTNASNVQVGDVITWPFNDTPEAVKTIMHTPGGLLSFIFVSGKVEEFRREDVVNLVG